MRFCRFTLTLTLLLALTVSLLGVPLGRANAQEPDNDNDAYDQVTCGGVEEDDVENIDPDAVEFPYGAEDMNDSSSRDLGNDPDEFSLFPNNNFNLPFKLEMDGTNFSFQPTYTQEEKALANDAFLTEPTLQITANADATPGSEVTFTIKPSSFASESSLGDNFYYAAWVDGKFVNGYSAGGSLEGFEQLSTSGGGARGDCDAVSRDTDIDQDGDGMDDNWEVRYGLNPNNPGDAGQDPDDDGYAATTFPNLLGEFLSPSPAIAGGELGDGAFTNLEEYILDTNPNVADTDSDGFPDEADAVGLGQHTMKFPASADSSQNAYEIHAIVVGTMEKRNEEEKKLTKIDSAFESIPARTREDLSVDLAVQTEVARSGEVLQVRAEPTGSESKDLLLAYEWSVNGEPQPALSGQGEQTLEYTIPEDMTPGEDVVIAVDVINPQTGQLAHGRTALVNGDSILLEYDPESVEKGKVIEVHALLNASQDPRQYLFLWSVDSALQKAQSKIGADTLSFKVEKNGGSTYQIQLELLEAESSKLAGKASQEIEVQKPTVTLELTPVEPVTGQTVTVRAETKHFATESLEYRFTIDGETSEPAGPIAQVSAGADGEFHEISVVASTSGDEPQTARAEISFTTKPVGFAAAPIQPSRVGTLLASARAGLGGRTTNAALISLALFGMVLGGGMFLVKRKSAQQISAESVRSQW